MLKQLSTDQMYPTYRFQARPVKVAVGTLKLMAQGCMGTEQQTRRSKRGNADQRQYCHDDEEIDLAAKEEVELQLAIERSKRKDREHPPKRVTPSGVRTLPCTEQPRAQQLSQIDLPHTDLSCACGLSCAVVCLLS